MNSHKNTARIVGILFLTAMVTSLVGGGLIEPVLTAPDVLTTISANKTSLILGVLLELTNAIAVVGIAVMMFPLFRRHSEALALGYFGARSIEAVLQIAGDIIPLSLLTFSQGYGSAGASQAAALQASGALWIAARTNLIGAMLGIFFSLGALVFYSLLYQSKLLPRFISVWGLLGAVLILAWNLLETFGIHLSAGMVLALPMILNEIFLGIWLIVKGFNSSAIATGYADSHIRSVTAPSQSS